MRRFVLLAAALAAFLGGAGAAYAKNEVRTLTNASVKPNKAFSNVAFAATFNSCTVSPCTDGTQAMGPLPDLMMHEDITLPSGFMYQGGIRKDLTKSAKKAPALAFATCSLANVSPTAGPNCPSKSEIGSGDGTAYTHPCGDGATVQSAKAAGTQTLSIRMFNGGANTIYARVNVSPAPLSFILTISFKGRLISYDVPDNALSPAAGLCAPLVQTTLKLNTKHVSAKVKEFVRVHGHKVAKTVTEGLVKSGKCPQSKTWSTTDAVKFTDGTRNPQTMQLTRNVTSTAQGAATVSCKK